MAAEKTLEGVGESVGVARRWLRDVCTLRGLDPEVTADAILVLSELATNAVAHTRSGAPGGTFTVRAEFTAGRLRISVIDAGAPTIPRPRTPSNNLALNGRGLRLVEAHALWWRATATTDSCTTTADIPTHTETPDL